MIPKEILSERCKEYIRQNHKRMSINAMARAQYVKWENVRDFMVQEDLEGMTRGKNRQVSTDAGARHWLAKKRPVKEGMFNVHQFRNWLLGGSE